MELNKTVHYKSEEEIKAMGLIPVKNAMGQVYAYQEDVTLDDLYKDNPYYKRSPARVNLVNMNS